MIRYTDSITTIHPSQLDGGFWVGWPDPPSPENHLQILEGSSHIWLAIDEGTDVVVGFINAISDGVLTAYIPLLEVLEPYQGQGIGTELATRMLVSLGSLYQIDLICDEDVQPFYQRLGMTAAGGMVIRNYDRQNASQITNQEVSS